jgi:hypothetical protein
MYVCHELLNASLDSHSRMCATRVSFCVLWGLNWRVTDKLRIISHNNFPTAAGLASSASGFACLSCVIDCACQQPCQHTLASDVHTPIHFIMFHTPIIPSFGLLLLPVESYYVQLKHWPPCTASRGMCPVSPDKDPAVRAAACLVVGQSGKWGTSPIFIVCARALSLSHSHSLPLFNIHIPMGISHPPPPTHPPPTILDRVLQQNFDETEVWRQATC